MPGYRNGNADHLIALGDSWVNPKFLLTPSHHNNDRTSVRSLSPVRTRPTSNCHFVVYEMDKNNDGKYQFPVHGERTRRLVQAEVDSRESTEGERRHERERRRRPRSPSPRRNMEEENARLREENEHLSDLLRIARFEQDQAAEKARFLQEQIDRLSSRANRRDDHRPSLYHPYPRAERFGYSREGSPGPDRLRRSGRSSTANLTPPAVRPDANVMSSSRTTVSQDVPMADATAPVERAPAMEAAAPRAPSSSQAPVHTDDPYADDGKDDSEGELSDGEYAKREEYRMIRTEHKAARRAARGKAAQPPPEPYVSSSSELHGRWLGVSIESVADWENLLAAAHNGDRHAIGYIAYLNTRYQRPDSTRTQGITALIKGYSSFAGTHKRALKDYKLQVARIKRQTLDEGTAAPPPTHPPRTLVPDVRNPLPEMVDSSDDYISQSPPSASIPLPGFSELSEGSTTNPRDPPQAVGRDWAETPVRNWPFGMRVSGNSGPRNPTDAELAGVPASPHLPDVEVIRWISELSPFRRRGVFSTRVARRAWYAMCVDLFSVPGLYRALVRRGSFPLGNRRRERFPFDTRNVDFMQVATWFHDHGLDAADPTVAEMERWATLLRGNSGGILDEDGNWNAEPYNIARALEAIPASADLASTFQYPPRVPSAHARSWGTASEMSVDQRRASLNLPNIIIGVATSDESEDTEMADTSTGFTGNAGTGLA